MENEPPEKYIRTFADDMQSVQAGSVPDFVPLQKSPQAAVEKPASPPPPSPAIPGQTPIQKPEISLPPPPKPPSPNIPKTYSSDFSDRVKETHASTATVLAAEQDSIRQAPQAEVQESSRNMLYVIAGVVLLVAGVVGVYFAYTRYTTVSAPVVLAPTVSAPIFVDDRQEVSGFGPALITAIAQSVSRPISVGTVRLLYFATTTASKSIFSVLYASAPDILLRNVQANGSMAGVVNINGTQSPFFILSVTSYSNTFSGMLTWESSIRDALKILFPPYTEQIVIAPIIATSTIATTTTKGVKKKTATSTPIAPPPVLTFMDDTVANHDVRIYRDAAGKSVILYGYWNQSTLVIARNPAAFTEILQRLATARTP